MYPDKSKADCGDCLNSVIRQGRWLASTLTWWPLMAWAAWSYLDAHVEVSAEVCLGLIITVGLAWLFTGWLAHRVSLLFFNGYVAVFVTATLIAFLISATLMAGVVSFKGRLVELAFIGAIALMGGVASGVAAVVAEGGCVLVLRGVVAALVGGGVVGVTFAVPGGVAGGATFILAGGAAIEAAIVFLLMTSIITFRVLRGPGVEKS